ncbi:MAG: LysR family transcriptional regulator [Clostridia bacterium]|nr:LysR family transcriptional regulator [Candidatus Pelethousia sp.]NCB30029.1 LysR family transcriptional regulator [Clostridia bacterium]
MEEPLSYRVQLRVYKGEKCFGRGIAELLTRVSRTGSLRSAAAEMDLAYSKAWRIIKTSEDVLGFRLLSSQAGGKHGGGALLTPEAQDMLARYDRFVQEGERALDKIFAQCFEGMVAP